MNRVLFEEVTGGEWLSKEQMDEMLQGKSIDEIEPEWMNLVRFTYQMEQFDAVSYIGELGAGTTIGIIGFHESEIDEPELADNRLLKSMQCQRGDVGKIARLIELDDSIDLDCAGQSDFHDSMIVLHVWT